MPLPDNYRLRYLKVKIKALAAEAAIIRFEERRVHGFERHLLGQHRRIDVRRAARRNLLAYACLRGRPYAQVESPATLYPPDWDEVRKLAIRFSRGGIGSTEAGAAFDAWRAEAEAWLRAQRQPKAA